MGWRSSFLVAVGLLATTTAHLIGTTDKDGSTQSLPFLSPTTTAAPPAKKAPNSKFPCPDYHGPLDKFGLEKGSHSKVSQDTFRYLVGCNPESLKNKTKLDPTRYRLVQRLYIQKINETINAFVKNKTRKRARRVPLCVKSTSVAENYHDQMGRFRPIIQEIEQNEDEFKEKLFYDGDPPIWYPRQIPGVTLNTDTDFGVEDIRLFRIFTGDPRMPVLRQWFHLAIYMRKDKHETQQREGIFVQAISAPMGLPFGEFRIDFDCDNPDSPLLSRHHKTPITHAPSVNGFYKDSLVFPCTYRSRYHLRHPNVFTVGGNPSLQVHNYPEFHVHFNWIDTTCNEAMAMQFLIVLVKSFKDKTYDVFYTPALNHTYLDSNDGLPYPFYPGWKEDKSISCNKESIPLYEDVSQELINSGFTREPRPEIFSDMEAADFSQEDELENDDSVNSTEKPDRGFFKNIIRDNPRDLDTTEPEYLSDQTPSTAQTDVETAQTDVDVETKKRKSKSIKKEDEMFEAETSTSISSTSETSQSAFLNSIKRSRKRDSVLKDINKVPIVSAWLKRKKRTKRSSESNCTDRTTCIMGQFQLIRRDIAIIPYNKEYDDCVITGRGILENSPLECPPEAVRCDNYFKALDDVEGSEKRIAFRAEILNQLMCDICTFPDDNEIFRKMLPPDIPVIEPTRAGDKDVNGVPRRRPLPVASLMDISYKNMPVFPVYPNGTRILPGATTEIVTEGYTLAPWPSSTPEPLEIVDYRNADGHIPFGKLKHFDRLIIYENQASKLNHGVLLILTWFFLIPVANFAARYFKESGGITGGFGICGMPLWLVTHVALYVLGFICIGLGVIEIAFPIEVNCERLPLVQDTLFCRGESSHGRLLTAHKVLGWLAIFCLLPQYILGWIRPDAHGYRFIFQTIHSCLGYAGYISAAISVFIVQTCVEIYVEVFFLVVIHVVFFGVGCLVQNIQDKNLLIYPPRRKFPVLEVVEIWEDPPNRKLKNILQFVHAILLGIIIIIVVVSYHIIARNDPLTNLEYHYDKLNMIENRQLIFDGLIVPKCKRTNYIYLLQQIGCNERTPLTFWCANPKNITNNS